MTPLSNTELEELCMAVVRRQDAAGVLMLVLTHDSRAEIIAAFTEGVDDLPGKLRRLADEVAEGQGIPLGRNLQTLNPKSQIP